MLIPILIKVYSTSMSFLVILASPVLFFLEGRGVFIATFCPIDRTDMMQAAVYEHPDGTVLPYRIFMPEDADRLDEYPLVIFLHGMGERGDDSRTHTEKNSIMQTLLNEENLERFPCIVLAPQCPDDRFWPLITGQLMGLFKQTQANYPVDPARIYITGMSMGGYGTFMLLAEYPGYFAAAVPIGSGGDPATAPALRDIPIWAFHGARDLFVRPAGFGGLVRIMWLIEDSVRDFDVRPLGSRDMVKALREAGSTVVKYTEYPREGHFCWELAYREPELFPWMFAQTRG